MDRHVYAYGKFDFYTDVTRNIKLTKILGSMSAVMETIEIFKNMYSYN